VWILSDDMYEHLVFDGFQHATMAQVAPDLRDRVLTVSGVSKTYAMTGWRVGFAGGPKALIRGMVNMQGQATAGVSTVGQAAATAALNGPQDGVQVQIDAYKRRRDLAVEMLNASPGMSCHKPEGAFYVFPNVAGCIGKTTAGGRLLQTDQDVCLALLEEQYVATVHGAAYHMSPYLRISTATADAELLEGLKRIQTFCEGLH
jgi:aspartate aminotransferase